jgi:NADPH-dependent glutamate synthase beta subunit-like oxidoreductase
MHADDDDHVTDGDMRGGRYTHTEARGDVQHERGTKQDEEDAEFAAMLAAETAKNEEEKKKTKKNEKKFDKMFKKSTGTSSVTSSKQGGSSGHGKVDEVYGIEEGKVYAEGSVEYWNQRRKALGIKPLKH